MQDRDNFQNSVSVEEKVAWLIKSADSIISNNEGVNFNYDKCVKAAKLYNSAFFLSSPQFNESDFILKAKQASECVRLRSV